MTAQHISTNLSHVGHCTHSLTDNRSHACTVPSGSPDRKSRFWVVIWLQIRLRLQECQIEQRATNLLHVTDSLTHAILPVLSPASCNRCRHLLLRSASHAYAPTQQQLTGNRQRCQHRTPELNGSACRAYLATRAACDKIPIPSSRSQNAVRSTFFPFVNRSVALISRRGIVLGQSDPDCRAVVVPLSDRHRHLPIQGHFGSRQEVGEKWGLV